MRANEEGDEKQSRIIQCGLAVCSPLMFETFLLKGIYVNISRKNSITLTLSNSNLMNTIHSLTKK